MFGDETIKPETAGC